MFNCFPCVLRDLLEGFLYAESFARRIPGSHSHFVPVEADQEFMRGAVRKHARRWWLAVLFLCLLLQYGSLRADPVAVRYREGSVHGFLALRTLDGKVLAAGDLTQIIRGNQAISHLVFRFKDGSVDDETAVFRQRGDFQLVRDHHIQRGPSFPKPADVLIDATRGEVIVRYKDKGREKVETEHLQFPPDLANGIILDVLKNISPDTKETKLSYVAAAPKPRMVKLSISPEDEESFRIAGTHHKAIRFRIKAELGGITGMIAPFIGKQPADTSVWISAGEVPAFVKLEGPLYLGGPIYSIEMTSPVW